jgi:hypothetical protein
MMGYERLSGNPSVFKSFTSLKVSEFDALYARIEGYYATYEERRLYREDRKRRLGRVNPSNCP